MTQQDNNFHFSRKSRAGALVLLGILILLAIAWRLLPAMMQPTPDPKEKELQLAWEQFRKERITESAPDGRERDPAYSKTTAHTAPMRPHMAPFDPNTAVEEELLALGLPLRTARTLINYRSKGGRFRRREDLQKLYTLSKEDYERIAPYVHIPGEGDIQATQQPTPSNIAKQQMARIELNDADAAALISLRGIGPGYSRRILGFRDALGGFIKVEQLQEVYGFPDSTYQQLKDKFSADPGRIKKINLNMATEEELGRHPYIGKKLAANIIKLRNDLKNYSDLEQLRQVPLINEEKYRKIAPYLSTQ